MMPGDERFMQAPMPMMQDGGMPMRRIMHESTNDYANRLMRQELERRIAQMKAMKGAGKGCFGEQAGEWGQGCWPQEMAVSEPPAPAWGGQGCWGKGGDWGPGWQGCSGKGGMKGPMGPMW